MYSLNVSMAFMLASAAVVDQDIRANRQARIQSGVDGVNFDYLRYIVAIRKGNGNDVRMLRARVLTRAGYEYHDAGLWDTPCDFEIKFPAMWGYTPNETSNNFYYLVPDLGGGVGYVNSDRKPVANRLWANAVIGSNPNYWTGIDCPLQDGDKSAIVQGVQFDQQDIDLNIEKIVSKPPIPGVNNIGTSVTLPIIGGTVKARMFLLVAPWIIAIAALYLQIYLWILAGRLRALEATESFHGQSLQGYVYPWIGIAARYDKSRPLTLVAAMVLNWSPTFALFGLMYLAYDWAMTVDFSVWINMALVAGVVTAGILWVCTKSGSLLGFLGDTRPAWEAKGS